VTNWIGLLLSALNLVVFTISILFLGRQLKEQQAQLHQQQLQIEKADLQVRKEHDWNRRRAVVEMARDYCSEERVRMRARLEAVASWYDPSHSWASLAPAPRAEIETALKLHLNYLEGIAIGVKHSVYDREIAYEFFGAHLPAAYRWARTRIEQARAEAGDPSIWEALERLSTQWSAENAQIAALVASERWREGKPPT
jgi:hypothetical protein